jgi:hypothetical protein
MSERARAQERSPDDGAHEATDEASHDAAPGEQIGSEQTGERKLDAHEAEGDEAEGDEVEGDEAQPASPSFSLEAQWPRVRPFVAPLVVLAALGAGWALGPAVALLVLAAGALVGVISLFWSSLRALLGETRLSGAEAYLLAVPVAEEERKRAVLRALKDIEFEHAVGKISDADYAALAAKYRAEAKALLRSLEEQAQPRRDKARAVAERMRGKPSQPDAAPPTETTP